MFTLPSLPNILVSTLVFIVVAWVLRRIFDEQGMPAGMARGLVVFVFAYAVSWCAGEVIDWAEIKLYGAQPSSQIEQDLNHLLKNSGINSSAIEQP